MSPSRELVPYHSHMTRTPVQDKLIAALTGARTSEPYPVWVTWDTLCRNVYGHTSHTNRLNLRRIAANAGIDQFKYDNGRCAGASLRMSRPEQWLHNWTLKTTNRLNHSADYHAYVAPTNSEILRALKAGLTQRRTSVDVAKVVKIVNTHCGTDFALSETAWSVLGYQLTWDEERDSLMQRLVNAFNSTQESRLQEERRRRLITVGPFEIDPTTQQSCPCCQQTFPNGLPPQRRAKDPLNMRSTS